MILITITACRVIVMEKSCGLRWEVCASRVGCGSDKCRICLLGRKSGVDGFLQPVARLFAQFLLRNGVKVTERWSGSSKPKPLEFDSDAVSRSVV
jgi:hypothetical protein